LSDIGLSNHKEFTLVRLCRNLFLEQTSTEQMSVNFLVQLIVLRNEILCYFVSGQYLAREILTGPKTKLSQNLALAHLSKLSWLRKQQLATEARFEPMPLAIITLLIRQVNHLDMLPLNWLTFKINVNWYI
jgi:hypothetical protein